MEETQQLEVTAVIEKPDSRAAVLQDGIKQTILHPSEKASSQIKIISEQYVNAAPLLDSLSEPGRTSELISALQGIAQSAGVQNFEVAVSLPDDAHPGEKERAMTDRARELYQQMPDLIAQQYLSKYNSLKEKEAGAYQQLEAATQKDDAEVSRAEVRALAFDRRLVGYEMRDEEERILELIDAPRVVEQQLSVARAESHAGRIDTQRALEIVDGKKSRALEKKIEDANRSVSRREQRLDSMLTERPMIPMLASSRDLDEATTVLIGYWPNLANEKIAIELQKEHARLVPLVDKIKEGKEAVAEKAVQLRNVVKNGWDVVIKRTANGYMNDIREVAGEWKANVARNKAELEQEDIQGKREYYNKRHELAVQKQMKTELELVRRQGREQGLSAARIEGMIEERRQQYAEVKRPNENIAFFQDKLAEHVHTLVVLEEAVPETDTRRVATVSSEQHSPVNLETSSPGEEDTARVPVIDIKNVYQSSSEDTTKMDMAAVPM